MRKVILIMSIFFFIVALPVSGETPKKTKFIIAGIDSLTKRSCCQGTGYITPFTKMMKDKYGDGGPGYIAFDTTGVEYSDVSLTRSAALKDISSVDAGKYPSQYSFDLKGTYTNNGAGGSLSVKINDPWETGTLFYLIQPNGGTFKIGNKTIYTKGLYNIGKVSIATKKVEVTQIKGKVAIFGGLFLNKMGVAVSRIGKGGDTLKNHDLILDQFKTKWISLLSPDLFLVNTGISEYYHANSSTEQFKKSLDKFLSAYNGTKKVIVEPNSIKDDNGTIDGYRTILKNYAQLHKDTFTSNRTILGKDYNKANNNGLMEDDIHPSPKGNQLIAENLFKVVKTLMN